MPVLESSTLQPVLPFVDRWLARYVATRRVPGVQVAVRVGGELVFSQAYGSADLGAKTPLTTSHLFRVASHSKWYAATVAMKLHETGVLALDSTVGAVLPEYGMSDFRSVTLRELLSHRSGMLRDGVDSDHWELGHAFPDAETLHQVVTEHGKVFDPHVHFKYSNLGYGVAGQMIERATGSTFAEAVRDLIVSPLGLTNTASSYLPQRADDYARGHSHFLDDGSSRVVIEHIDTHALDAATGFTSTAEDMTAFASAHVFGNDALISDRSKREMYNPATVFASRLGGKERYGLGTFTVDINDRDLVGHSGGYPGQLTRTMVDPRSGLAVSVLMNGMDSQPSWLASVIVKMLDLAPAPASSWNDQGSDVDRSAFTGRFYSRWGYVELVDTGRRLLLLESDSVDPGAEAEELTIVDENRLRPRDDHGYAVSGEDMVVTRDAAGAIQSLRIGGLRHTVERPAPPASGRLSLEESRS